MNQGDYFQALILVAAAQVAMKQRRKTETICGYPPEYGGDEEILKGIDKFLANTNVSHDLIDAMDFYTKLKEDNK